MSEISETEIKSMSKEQNYCRGYKDGKMDVLDTIREEINTFGSLWVQYEITGHTDRDIQNIVVNVLKQAKEQVIDIIDKYKEET